MLPISESNKLEYESDEQVPWDQTAKGGLSGDKYKKVVFQFKNPHLGSKMGNRWASFVTGSKYSHVLKNRGGSFGDRLKSLGFEKKGCAYTN